MIKKLKILVDAHKFDESLQGISTYIKGLYNALVKYDDIEITLCAQDIDNLKEHFTDAKFRFIALNKGSKYKRLALEYPKIISDGNFDFAHFQYVVPPIKKCKYVDTLHDLLFLEFKSYFPWKYRFVNGNLFRFSAYMSDLVLTVSEYSKKSIHQELGIDENRILITPNAVSPRDFKRIDVKKKYNLDKFILFVSRFEPRKNHLTLLHAYKELRLFDEGYELVFVGLRKEPIEIAAYNQVLSEITDEIRDKVKVLEGITEDELYSLYANSSCFVFPSLAEGFGIPPLEAAIAGAKVVCSNTTAMADFRFFKYHFDPNRLEELKSILTKALSDNQYPYTEIRDEILKIYNWDTIANDYYSMLIKSYEQ